MTQVGDSAFALCTSLSSVRFSDAALTLGEWVFGSCESLKNLTLPAGIRMGDYCFIDCTALESVTLPADLEDLPNGTFEGCTALGSVTLPAGLCRVGDYAFYKCGELTLHLAETVSKVGASAFDGCTIGELSYQGSVYDYRAMTLCPKNESLKSLLDKLFEADLPEDLDEDGAVTISDVTFLLNLLAASEQKDADLDGDGNTTISDVTYLLNYLSGGK